MPPALSSPRWGSECALDLYDANTVVAESDDVINESCLTGEPL